MINNWNTHLENLLKLYAYKSLLYKYLHSDNSKYCTKVFKYISITSITLNTIVASSNTLTTFLIETFSNTKIIINLLYSFLLMGVAICSAYNYFLDYNKIAENHKIFSIRYSILYDSIQRTLSLEVEDRKDSKEFFLEITKEYDYLTSNAPSIMEHIKNKEHNTELKKLEKIVEYENCILKIKDVSTHSSSSINAQSINVQSINPNTPQHQPPQDNISEHSLSQDNEYMYHLQRYNATKI